VKLLILGSGTGLPNPKRAAPGYVLNVEEKNLLLDSGSGTFQRLIECGVTYQDIDYILYSHLHPDHTLDFISMLFASRNPRNLRKKDLIVIGPEGLEDFYNKMVSLYGSTIIPEKYKIILKEVADGEIDLGICRISTKVLLHSSKAIGFRIEAKDGGALVYSGDTDYCENIVRLSEGADTLLLDSSFPDEFKMEGHLTPSEAGRVAEEAGAKRLILTHLYPVCDRYPILKQCRKSFKGKIMLARDYMSIKL